MWTFKQKARQIFECIKFFLYKISIKPTSLIFTIIFPLGLSILFWTLSSNQIKIEGTDKEKTVINTFFASSVLFLPILSTAFMSLPSGLALDRLHKRLKIYSVFGINKKDYIIANITTIFIIYFSVFMIQLIVLNFAYSVNLKFEYFLLIVLINICTFFICSIYGFFISSLPKNDKSVYIIVSLIYYPVFILGVLDFGTIFFGIVINTSREEFFEDINTSKYVILKFIHFVLPTNTGSYLTQNIINTNIHNNNIFSWNIDWIGIVLHTSIATLLGIYTIKKFKWK